MAQLNKDMEGLMGMKTQLEAAMKAASDVVTSHAKAADEVLAKYDKKKK
jgi:hypothetical protein